MEEVKEQKSTVDSIQEAKMKLNRDWTMLCAELGDKVFADFMNSQIEAKNKKEKEDILSRLETLALKAGSLQANQPKEEIKTEEVKNEQSPEASSGN